MTYYPLDNQKAQEWIDFANQLADNLNGRYEDGFFAGHNLFNMPDSDIALAKDLVGTLLAVLTNQVVTID